MAITQQIDVVTAAPKTQETLPIKTAEMQKPINDNINAFAQVEKNAQDSSEITIRPNPGEMPDFRYESGDRDGNGTGYYYDSNSEYYKKKRKNAKKPEVSETEEEKKLGRGFDIRV